MVDIDAGGGEGVGRPDVLEGAAAVVGDPKAPILCIPVAIDAIGRGGGEGRGDAIGRGRGDPGLEFCGEGLAGGEAAMTTDEFYVIAVGAVPGLPFTGNGARVAGTCGQADTAYYIGAAAGCLEHGLRAAKAAEGGGIVGDEDLGGHGTKADEGSVGPEMQWSGDAVPALGQV